MILPAALAALATVAACPVVAWGTGRRPRVPAVAASVVAAAAMCAGFVAASASSTGGSRLETAAWVALATVLAVQVHIDVVARRLPRQISYVGLVVVAATLCAARLVDPVGPRGGGLVGMLTGAVLLTGITALLVVGSGHRLGPGDIHLSPLLGAALGWFDPWWVVAAWFLTAVAGGLGVVVLFGLGRAGRGSRVPYGPFMVAGTVAAVAGSALA